MYIHNIKILYRVSGKKVSLLIELLVGILLKLQLKTILFFQKPCIVADARKIN